LSVCLTRTERLAVPGRRALVAVAVAVPVLAITVVFGLRALDLNAIRQNSPAWHWLLLSLLLNLGSVAAKAVVWKVALDAVPALDRLGYRQIVPALFIGFLLNTVLFARLGEPARIAALVRRQRPGHRAATVAPIAGTVVAEQLAMGAALALVIAGLAAAYGLPPLAWFVAAALAATIGGVLAASAVARRRTPGGRVARVLGRAAGGQALFGHARSTAQAVLFGALSWIAQIAGIAAALAAFRIDTGVEGVALVFVGSTVVQAFPFWPGNVGLFQVGVAAPLTQLYAVPASTALSFGVGLQFVEALLGVGLGAAFLVREGLSLGELRRSSPALSESGS
jgi:uncharacterized membrane protein YbhN (UPF0104 family)